MGRWGLTFSGLGVRFGLQGGSECWRRLRPTLVAALAWGLRHSVVCFWCTMAKAIPGGRLFPEDEECCTRSAPLRACFFQIIVFGGRVLFFGSVFLVFGSENTIFLRVLCHFLRFCLVFLGKTLFSYGFRVISLGFFGFS